ncbi:CHAT domain-containing protein [Mycena latifolia]|nr:CHAT domain-containing protein [Mycena latifolia]
MSTNTGTDKDGNAVMFRMVAGNFAKAFYSAYLQHGRIEDLDRALNLMRELLVDLDSGRFDYVNIVGQILRLRFEALDEVDDIDESVLYYREAISLLPTVDEHRRSACAHMVHTGLAATYSSRFRAFARLEDLESSIAQYVLAVALGPQSDGNYANSVSGLASALVTRFKHQGELNDLRTAVALIRRAFNLLDETDTQRISLTFTLANTLWECFEQSGDLDELDEAIALFRAVIAVRAEDHPQMVLAIANLATAHRSRYERLNDIEDLSSAILLHETALTLLAEENPSRATVLNNLGIALMTRFEKMGERRDLEKGLECYRDALAIRGPGNPHRPMALMSMGRGLLEAFNDTGRIEELDEGIAHYREAITLLPEGHRHQTVALGNLATLLSNRFTVLEQAPDLEEALEFSRQNLELHPIGDSGRPSALGRCASILFQRFHSFGLVQDLSEAANYRQEALELCPEEHYRRSAYIYDLARASASLYTFFHQPEALEIALHNHTLALSLRPEGHADRLESLEGVAAVYSVRFTRYGRVEDLEVAISRDREALSLCPPGKPHRFIHLNALAVDLCTRFDQLGELADLTEAIECFSEAKNSLPQTALPQSRLDRHLAIAYLKQHDVEPSADLLAKAFRHFERGFSHMSAAPGEAVQTFLNWAAAARTHGVRVPLAAYSRALALHDQTAGVMATVDVQQQALAAPGAPRTIALDAAAVAIEDGQLKAAVELLEQGRAILWTRMRGYRTSSSLAQLHDMDAALAARFGQVNKQLEVLATSSEHVFRDGREWVLDVDQKMKRQRVLQEERDALLLAIRQLDGFAHFLLPVPFEALRSAAEEGPVILVNVSEYRCDALILQEAGAPTLVPLPDLSLDELRELNGQFVKARGKVNSKQLVVILRALWKKVAQPVVEKLVELEVPKNTRIWWCPTSFLCGFPLHAAGMYTKAEPDANVPNHFISSYTPTLSALIQARADVQPNPHVQVLVIGQSAEELPAVTEEIAAVKGLGDFVNTLVGEAATKVRVLPAMQQHSYIHFACHAEQRREPFKSAFKLHEGDLCLLDVVQAQLPRADFAFLSACSTATGDAVTPDEVIHLAAALQFAGFRSVVGTLWAMADVDGPFVAREFYGHMFREGAGNADFRDAAVALHGAMRALRKKEPQSVGRWINFIHVGA